MPVALALILGECVKALFECFRFFRSENLKFRKWACFQNFRKACLSRALFRFSDVCGLRAVSDLWRQFSNWTQTWSSEKLKIWRNFFRFAIRIIPIWKTENRGVISDFQFAQSAAAIFQIFRFSELKCLRHDFQIFRSEESETLKRGLKSLYLDRKQL